MKAKMLISLLLCVIILVSCGNNAESNESNESSDAVSVEESSAEISVAVSETAEESSEEVSEEISEEQSEEVSEDYVPVMRDVEIMYCSFDQRPNAVIVGKCSDDALVTLESTDGQKVTSQSFYGWFSIRFKYASNTEYTISQSINGFSCGESATYSGKPKTPGDEGIIAGYNGQFFYEKCLPDFMQTNIPSESELSALTEKVRNRIEKIHNVGLETEIIYIIAPSVISVYPECVPEEYTQGTGKTRRQLIMEALREGGATVIDLDEVFAEHKNDKMTLFYKTDSHWTEYGAFIAYTELFNIIAEKFPDAAPHSFNYFNWYGGYHKTGDMLNYLKMTTPVYLTPGITDADCLEYSWFRTLDNDVTGVTRKRFEETGVYSEEVTKSNTVKTERSNLPNCVVIRDSYGTQLNDLIAGNMNTTYYTSMWDYTFNLGTLRRYKADYLIYVMSEWNCGQAFN